MAGAFGCLLVPLGLEKMENRGKPPVPESEWEKLRGFKMMGRWPGRANRDS